LSPGPSFLPTEVPSLAFPEAFVYHFLDIPDSFLYLNLTALLIIEQMAWKEFWRVEDDESMARYKEGKGIHAGAVRSTMTFDLYRGGNRRQLGQGLPLHLDWGHRGRTGFISVYSNEERAKVEARRRVSAGKSNVVIHWIGVPELKGPHRVEYRQVRRLMKDLGKKIPYKAYHNSKHEFVFLHRIPEHCVLKTFCCD
jgi:hypothetical protein